MSSGPSDVDVQHAIIIGIYASETAVLLEFVSGEGAVVDNKGESLDPLMFTVVFEPESLEVMQNVLELFWFWKEDEDPIDVVLKDGYISLLNTETGSLVQTFPPTDQ